MILSVCPKCDSGTFELAPLVLENKDETILAVCCYNCHTVLGTLADTESIDKKLHIINENMGKLMNGMKELLNQVAEVRKKIDS